MVERQYHTMQTNKLPNDKLEEILQSCRFDRYTSRVLHHTASVLVQCRRVRSGRTDLFCCFERFVRRMKILVQFQYRGYVPAPVAHDVSECLREGEGKDGPIAVIWRAPDGDDRIVKHQFMTLHHLSSPDHQDDHRRMKERTNELMSSRDEVEIVRMNKLLHDVRAKEVACSTR